MCDHLQRSGRNYSQHSIYQRKKLSTYIRLLQIEENLTGQMDLAQWIRRVIICGVCHTSVWCKVDIPFLYTTLGRRTVSSHRQIEGYGFVN